jgi:folate-binding protein YgfZ
VRRIADQYRILEESAGWIDRSGRGRLRIEGRDAVPFLHALVTNDIQRLTRGQGVYAAYLTPQGRMVADLVLYHRGDALLAGVAPGLAASLAERLDQVIFTEDVHVSDVSRTFAELLVTGGAAATVIGGALGLEPGALARLSELAQRDLPGQGFVARSGEAPLDAFTLIVPAALREDIGGRLERAGARPMSAELVNALRIAVGRPAFGIDMTADTIPLEAGLLDRAISTTKGCYVGQEIVIRILHRGGGRVARRLVRLAWDAGGEAPLPPGGSSLLSGGRAVGQLTSAAPALTGRGAIGLGYVTREAAHVGATVAIGDGGAEASIQGFAG